MTDVVRFPTIAAWRLGLTWRSRAMAKTLEIESDSEARLIEDLEDKTTQRNLARVTGFWTGMTNLSIKPAVKKVLREIGLASGVHDHIDGLRHSSVTRLGLVCQPELLESLPDGHLARTLVP